MSAMRCKGATTVDEVRPAGDSAAKVVVERAISTNGGLVTKAAVEDSALAGRSADPRLMAWMVHHAAQVLSTLVQSV